MTGTKSPTRKRPRARSFEERCDLLLDAARVYVKRKPTPTWIEFANAYQGMGGWLQQFFGSLTEIRRFMQSPQHEELGSLWDELDIPEGASGGTLEPANGKILLRLPKSLHAALLREADSEEVSLNQLCMAKLARQLRAVV